METTTIMSEAMISSLNAANQAALSIFVGKEVSRKLIEDVCGEEVAERLFPSSPKAKTVEKAVEVVVEEVRTPTADERRKGLMKSKKAELIEIIIKLEAELEEALRQNDPTMSDEFCDRDETVAKTPKPKNIKELIEALGVKFTPEQRKWLGEKFEGQEGRRADHIIFKDSLSGVRVEIHWPHASCRAKMYEIFKTAAENCGHRAKIQPRHIWIAW